MGRWQRGRDPLSLLIIDADHFKRINDTHGHGVGNDVLRAIASIMQDQVRELDLVARFGGEEFVIVLPSTDAIGGRACGERSRQSIEAVRVPTPGGGRVRVTVSVGVAQATRQLGTIELERPQSLSDRPRRHALGACGSSGVGTRWRSNGVSDEPRTPAGGLKSAGERGQANAARRARSRPTRADRILGGNRDQGQRPWHRPRVPSSTSSMTRAERLDARR